MQAGFTQGVVDPIPQLAGASYSVSCEDLVPGASRRLQHQYNQHNSNTSFARQFNWSCQRVEVEAATCTRINVLTTDVT